MNLNYQHKRTPVGDLKPGAVFCYNGTYYMRIRQGEGEGMHKYPAVSLTSGMLAAMPSGMLVEHLEDACLGNSPGGRP